MTRYHCPCCRAFIPLQAAINSMSDSVFCRCCGTTVFLAELVALVAGTRRAETRPLVAQVADFQNGPPVSSEGNALSNLLPNGKIQKVTVKKDQSCKLQFDLFGGAL